MSPIVLRSRCAVSSTDVGDAIVLRRCYAVYAFIATRSEDSKLGRMVERYLRPDGPTRSLCNVRFRGLVDVEVEMVLWKMREEREREGGRERAWEERERGVSGEREGGGGRGGEREAQAL
eukprot:1177181-Rhodomonas_salina.1